VGFALAALPAPIIAVVFLTLGDGSDATADGWRGPDLEYGHAIAWLLLAAGPVVAALRQRWNRASAALCGAGGFGYLISWRPCSPADDGHHPIERIPRRMTGRVGEPPYAGPVRTIWLRSGTRRSWLAVIAVALATAATLVVAPGADPAGSNPFAQRSLYVDARSWAADAATTLPAGTPEQLAAQRIAAVPQARWVTDTDTRGSVDRYVSAATAAHATGALVLYAIPHRDCQSYSAGGFSDTQDYRAWVREVRAGIGRRPVAVIVEPDAITSADCLSEADRVTRLALLRDAVRTLSADPGTAVYLDGGHSRWLTARDLATRLSLVGVRGVRGFSLNVSNFLPTEEQIAYGEQVSGLLGGAHYVIDTSRNGLGPAPDEPLNWCNPAGRALGPEPTAVTAGAHADAYLWIKRPGESDGSCRPGEPVSGRWFAEYAAGLVARG